MFFAKQGNNRYFFSCFAFAFDIRSFQFMDRHVHTDLYSKGITDIFSVVSLLHSKYNPSSTWTVTYTLICIPRKAGSYVLTLKITSDLFSWM